MKKKNERGFALILELMLVCLITTILMAMALPAYQRVLAIQEEQAARSYMRTIAWAESTISLCNLQPGCSVPVGVSSLVPTLPTVTQYGYSFNYVSGACWQISATPMNSAMLQRNYFMSCDGLLHAQSYGTGIATASSPVWAY